MAKNSAEKYITVIYSERDFELEDVVYSFKDGYYHVKVNSPSSIDTHFEVSMSWNKVVYDSYEDDVLSGWNTYERIDYEYSKMVDRVFSSPVFQLESEIDYGTIKLIFNHATSE